MKCDELKADNTFVFGEECLACKKSEVDAAIAELKAENERLKKKMDDYHLMSDIRRAKIKELKRALWLARAERAESEARGWYHSNAYIIKYDGLHNIKGVLNGKGFKHYPDKWMKLWIKIERLCRAKAEAYK